MQANHPPTIVREHTDLIRKSELKIYFEFGNAHEYRMVDGAKHEDGTLPARLEDAVPFISRELRETGNSQFGSKIRLECFGISRVLTTR